MQEETRQQGCADGVQGDEDDDHGQLAQIVGHDEEDVPGEVTGAAQRPGEQGRARHAVHQHPAERPGQEDHHAHARDTDHLDGEQRPPDVAAGRV